MQLKDFVSITASLINRMRGTQTRVTDFNVGSVARTMLEAPASEIEELYQQMFIGLREAIPVSVYNAFDFARRPAQRATGVIRYTVTSSGSVRSLPGGSVFERPGTGLTVAVNADVPIAAGVTFVDVAVTATAAGLIAPVPAGTAFLPDAAGDGFVSAVAQGSFWQGADAESADAQRQRFVAFLASLHRGTKAALSYALDTFCTVSNEHGVIVERAALHRVDEPWLSDPNDPPGLIEVYIHNGVNGASSELLTRTREVLVGYDLPDGTPVAGYKAAGTQVAVIAAVTQTVNVTGVATLAAGVNGPAVRALVQASIAEYLFGLGIGDDVIRAELYAAAMSVAGVVDFVPSAPAANVVVPAGAKAVPGTLVVT